MDRLVCFILAGASGGDIFEQKMNKGGRLGRGSHG